MLRCFVGMGAFLAPIPEGMHITGTGRGGASGERQKSTEKSPSGRAVLCLPNAQKYPRGKIFNYFLHFRYFSSLGKRPALGFRGVNGKYGISIFLFSALAAETRKPRPAYLALRKMARIFGFTRRTMTRHFCNLLI